MSPQKLSLLQRRSDAQTQIRGPATRATNRDLIDDFGSAPVPSSPHVLVDVRHA